MSKTILVVEDTEDDVFFLKRALTAAEISNPVQVVMDGQQALDYMAGKDVFADREKHPLPFLILLDLKLPYVMGLEVLQWIRERPQFKSILIAILTSSQADTDIAATTRLGGDFYLVKPATKQKLAELVKSLAVQWD